MYARRQTRPKPRTSQVKRWAAPTAGWVANRALADPSSIEGQGAAVLDNFFPRSTSVALRRGELRFATLPEEELPVLALFSYRNGPNERLFGANEESIYDITTGLIPDDMSLVTQDNDLLGDDLGNSFGLLSTAGLPVSTGYTGGEWIVTQFATTGGVYLIGVNGKDTGFIYDGTTFFPYLQGGVIKLSYDTQTTPFTVGSTVTGGTSGATGKVWLVDAAYLYLTNVTGTFVDNEALTGGGGAALVNGAPTVAVPGPNLDTSKMAFVWTYKNRLFFAEANTMNAYYLTAPDAVGGPTDVFPLAGVFTQGGTLLFGAAWSMDSSGDGGLSEQCIFVSDLGEVAVYQGIDPSEADSWSKVGLYKIGPPLGRRAFIRGGGDLAIATTVGLVPLSKAISLDVTALNVATVSYKIADAWADAVTLRGALEWQCEVWPDAKMAMVSPPDIVGAPEPVIFVSNTETGAWARFTGWYALCMEVFQGKLYFGSSEGKVFLANVGGNDDGNTYSGAVVPLFEDFGVPSAAKVAKIARARVRATTTIRDSIDTRTDFNMSLPVAPDATPLPVANVWDSGVWNNSVWGAGLPTTLNQDWRSASDIGYSLSVCYQLTSGSIAPLDAELIDMELHYTQAEFVS